MTKEGSGDWWTKSWNPVTGCTPCSPGCAHCWAAGMVRRFPHLHGDGRNGGFPGGSFGVPHIHWDRLEQPLGWRKPQRVFVSSLGDLFHSEVPFGWIERVVYVVRLAHWHTFVFLTKRAGLMEAFLSHYALPEPLPNLWVGVTVCDQREVERKVGALLRTPAAVRFLHVEPMLGPVCLAEWMPWSAKDTATKLDWVVCGGENGPGARPMSQEWACALRDQCHEAGVPFWFKGCGTNATTGLPPNHAAYRWLDGAPGPLELPEVKPWTR